MKQLLCCLLILLVLGCKQKYDSPVHSPVTGYLVVDGIVNSGAGSTIIKLSRTAQLDSTNIVFERGATVVIEGEDNSNYTLFETDSGHYNTGNLNLNSSIKYRLNISTADGKKYQSDFTPVKNNPPIDSISWKIENGGVQTYINTHDPQDTTLYYQWEYSEAWEFHTYSSELKYVVKNIPGDQIYSVALRDSTDPPIYSVCYQSDASTNILIGSSAKLSKDIINLPLGYVEPASWKISVLYSIDTKQYALTKPGYEFLEKMKKNTEGIGSIFDAQPSNLNGNIHCISNPAEPVVGYLNICPVQEKRIFITNAQVPNWNYNSYCYLVTIANNSDSIKLIGLFLDPTTVAASGLGIVSFNAAPPTCVDCELTGTHVKPFFWP
jgi:Domain of unknown function (DUF4249)